MFVQGTAAMFKLVNVHVQLGLLTCYGTLSAMLKLVLTGYMPESRHVEFLLQVMGDFRWHLWISAVVCVCLVSFIFSAIYGLLKRNVDGAKHESNSWADLLWHWLKSTMCMTLCGPFFFYSIGVCTWLAAVNVLTSRSFKYDVALKPTLPKSQDAATLQLLQSQIRLKEKEDSSDSSTVASTADLEEPAPELVP